MRNTKYQKGTISVEWTLITFALVFALFVPFNGEKSAAVQFMEGAREFHANSSFVLSLP